jgi:hypothetical protein
MKRYLVFAYQDYYPEGGWDDLNGSFDTFEEANTHLDHLLDGLKKGYVVDLVTGQKLVNGKGERDDPYRQIETLQTIIEGLHAIMRREGWQT